MAATSLEICNQALSRIGEPVITSLADTDRVSSLCALHCADTVQEVLRSHRWNFAIKRAILTPAAVTPTGIGNSGGKYQVTKAAHALATGQRVTMSDSSNYRWIAGTWRITVVSSSVFTLDDSTFTGSGAVDFTYALAGLFDWPYSVALPADCLRALEDDREARNRNVRWIVESGRVLTNSEELEFRYVEDVTDVTRFDSLFTQALVLKLAVKFETALRGTSPQTAALGGEYLQITAPLARRVDANEGQSRETLFPNQSKSIAARRRGA